MKKIRVIILLCICCTCCLCACTPKGGDEQASTAHQHVPNGADCQHALCCKDCGEQLAEQGAHVYFDTPDVQQDGYAYYECRVCGHLNIVNQGGMPVVPIE